MNRATALTVIVCVLLLASCAATKPIAGRDSTVQQKSVSFPKQGQQVHVLVGGLVHLKTDYQSNFTYNLAKPLNMGFMLGKVKVSPGDRLAKSTMDGEEVFCTATKVYYDPLVGPQAIVCFQSTNTGTFNNIKAAPGVVWFNKELMPPVEYVSSENAVGANGKPLKRELIFEGAEKESLLFTVKLYENSVEAASKLKPMVTKVDSVPSKVAIDGIEINIHKYTNNSLTYSIEKPWD